MAPYGFTTKLNKRMKKHLPHLMVISALALLPACNKAPDTGGAPSQSTAEQAAPTAAAPDPNLPEKKVEITGNDQMKFDVTAIDAKPGQKVTVTLKNTGTMPKMSMGHNFVLLTQDQDPAKFVE